MENTHLQLLAELPGLESAQQAIAARIDEIRRALGMAGAAAPTLPLFTADLGHDTLGRVIRRRNLSPEVKENRRRLIALARQKRIDKMAEREAYITSLEKKPPEAPVSPVSPVLPVKKVKTRG